MKKLKRVQQLLLVLCLGLLIVVMGRGMRPVAAETGATETPTPTETPAPTPAPVRVESIDYDDLWLFVDPGENTVVYYSDKAKKVWSEALAAGTNSEAVKTTGKSNLFCIDISWLKATSNGEINLKGDKNEDIVNVTIPARESKYKVKFNKGNGTLTFSSVPAGATYFEWRKATSYIWSDPILITDASKEKSAFWEELERLRVSGASIYVRIVGKDSASTSTAADGTSTTTFDVGKRPGKEIKINITKRANAPKIKINGSKLTVNTTTSMEYSTDKGVTWKDTDKAMALDKIAPGALVTQGTSGTTTTPTAQTVWFRKKAKGNTPYSKSFALTIPAQPDAPKLGEAFTVGNQDGKFCLNFLQASKATPYEYTVVKAGNTLNPAKASWKSVVANKTISLSVKTAPPGSIIYVRKKEIKLTKVTDQQLASAPASVEVTYVAPTP